MPKRPVQASRREEHGAADVACGLALRPWLWRTLLPAAGGPRAVAGKQTGSTATTLAKRRRNGRACEREYLCSAICACWVIRLGRVAHAAARGASPTGRRIVTLSPATTACPTGVAACCARPCGRAAEHGDELAAVHSITSSARTRIVSGMVIPRAFAVLRFTTSSNLAGRSMGRSAGLVPPKMRPT
jgi:hypothetical protein